MRIHLASDLHLEFGKSRLLKTEADVVILAGDIHTKLNGADWIREHFPDQRVLYVCGNHEYYGARFPSLTEKIREATAGTAITFLDNEGTVIDGYHFFGGTMWTDMALLEDPKDGAKEAAARMNDYKRIRNSWNFRKLVPRDTMAAHRSYLANLEQFAAGAPPEKTVVISHHAPSLLSLPKWRRNELISCAYASRLEGTIERLKPALWVHGHIHHTQDYRIAATRVVTNPRGYPMDLNPNYMPDLILEV